MKKANVLLIISLCINLSIYAQDNKKGSIIRLKSNLEFLASDELEGRYTGSPGEKVAAQFIASELKKYGVMPFGDSLSYFQDFPLVSKTMDSTSTLTLASANKSEIITEKLILSKDFSVWGGFLPGIIDSCKNYEIEFVGYGITADEYSYDDYADMDVKGKVVIFLSGEPFSDDPKFFNGTKETQYSNAISKFFLAASHGVAGIVLITPDRFESFIDRINPQSFNESQSFPDKFHVQAKFALPPVVYLYHAGVRKLFSNEKLNFDQLMEIQNSDIVSEKFKLNKTMRFTFNRNVTSLKARNVIGFIEGSNPNLKDEYVTISAHFDHLGIKNGRIFNGADDNASGTSAVLEIARRFALDKSNGRSIIVTFYTGEETGLFGSTYFVQTFEKINNVIVNLNMDMVGRESIDTLFCVGPDLCSDKFYEIIQNKNNESTKFTLDFSNSNYELVNRTDLLPYYSKNIPIVDFGDNMKIDYHRPTDDVEKINYEKMYKTIHLVELVATEISNMGKRLDFKGKL